MTIKENTRPSVAAPERAMETAALSGAVICKAVDREAQGHKSRKPAFQRYA